MPGPRSPAPESIRLVLLGLLTRYGPKHGYELRTLIEQQHLDYISDIQFGSIYAGLKRLTRDGLVEEVGRSRMGNRPDRVAFDVTELGRKELHRLLREAFVDPTQRERPLDLAVHFSGLLPLEEVAGLIRDRLAALESFEKLIKQAEGSTQHEHPGVRALIADISGHFLEVNRAERRWAQRVARRIDAGGYPTPGRTLDPDSPSGSEPS